MASFKRNIHYNIQVGIDARVNAMNEYHHSKQKLRSNLLAPSVSSESYTLSREAQVAKSTYVRMISPGMTNTHVIYGGFNIDDGGITGQSTGEEDYFKSQADRVTGPETAYYETATDKGSLRGQRPKAGITNVNVIFQGYGGAVRKATVTWACSTLEQLSKYQKGSFLSPGQTIILDWGWVRSDSKFRDREMPKFLIKDGDKLTLNKDLFSSQTEIINGDEFKKYTPVWDKMEITQYGDWSGIMGPVTKFTWSQRDDGGFDCITEILSRGSNIFEKQIPPLSQDKGATLSTFPGNRLTHDQFVTAVIKKSSETDKNFEKTSEKFQQPSKPLFNIAERIDTLDYEILGKYFSASVTGSNSMSAKLSTKSDYELLFTKDHNVFGILRPKGSDGEDSIELYEEEETDDGKKIYKRARDFSSELWVRWGWFEDNVVSYYSRESQTIGDSTTRLSEFRSLVSVKDTKYDWQDEKLTSVLIENPKELQTYNPSVFIIADKYNKDWFHIDPDDKKVDNSYKELAAQMSDHTYSFTDADTPEGKGKLRNLYINLSVIKKCFTNPGASIQHGMLSLAKSLNAGVNIWDFEIDHANLAGSTAQRTFFIKEKGDDTPLKVEGLCNICNKEESQSPAKSYIFDNYGENSLIHDISLTATVPDKFAMVAGFGAESGKSNKKKDAIKVYFNDTADSSDEKIAEKVGEFYSDPENASLFSTSHPSNPDLEFGNRIENYFGVPSLSAHGLAQGTTPLPTLWNHTIIKELADTTTSTRMSGLDIFIKKFDEAHEKIQADARRRRDAGLPFKTSDLFPVAMDPNSHSGRAQRAPYSAKDGKLKKQFVSNINWLLAECPATRLKSQTKEIIMPINIDMTLEGLGGVYPGNMFRLSYLPEAYGQVNFKDGEPEATPSTYFSIMGLTQTINQEGWQTKITAVTNKATIETSGDAKVMAETRDAVLKAYNGYMREFTSGTPVIGAWATDPNFVDNTQEDLEFGAMVGEEGIQGDEGDF
jgi:hypothetical protein